jgi:hypothetical protein
MRKPALSISLSAVGLFEMIRLGRSKEAFSHNNKTANQAIITLATMEFIANTVTG